MRRLQEEIHGRSRTAALPGTSQAAGDTDVYRGREHTRDLLTGLLSYSDAQVQALIDEEVVGA